MHGLAFGEPVAALVELDADVALDPVEGHVVAAVERVELLPEVLVEHGLAVGLLPAAALPARHPLRDAVL